MSEITIKINGIECKTEEGEYILNVARANDIFIPAICYLNQCSPTLACRLCIVNANGKRVYSCNTKAKEGMEIITDSEDIAEERKSIMQVYDVNHPLQCGVCDKSGECELQNYTLYMNLDEQNYSIADCDRSAKEWGVMKYDPALCIVCEKCVTVCKDMIGSSALKTVKRGGALLDKSYKTSMPKDAYAMWNKLQKSIIGYDESSCIDCGECIAVCPVGAMASSDFQYTSNAWELKRIPASNPHSSDCSLIYYEVKHGGIDSKGEEKIYRVTNDSHYTSLNGAARFGYDFENRVAGKDKATFEKVVDFIKNRADTIKFNSFITNEEALILQKIKEKYNLKLVNDDALSYQKFLKNYSKVSGKSLYSGDLRKVKNSDFVISVGTALKYDSPNSSFAFNNALTMNKGAGIYFHPMRDTSIDGFSKNIMQINHKVDREEAILYLLIDLFADKEKLPKEVKEYLDSLRKKVKKVKEETIKEKVTTKQKDPKTGEEKEITKLVPKKVKKEIEVEESSLLEEINAPEDFTEKLEKFLAKKSKFSLIVGEDLYRSDKAENLAKLIGLFDKYSNFEVVIIPSNTNTLGVSLICDLDKEGGEHILGYNEKGEITLSALGDGDLDIPALNQQEGTFTNIDKRVVPTNVAIKFNGYNLNDIANALDISKRYTIDYTKELPKEAGFEPLEFDLFPNFFDNGGNELRGYLLRVDECNSNDDVEKISKSKEMEGMIAYRANPINQFSPFTNKAHQLREEGGVYLSSSLLERIGVKEGEKVTIKSDKGELETIVKVDKFITGDIVYLPTFDKKLDINSIFDNERFTKVTIKGVSNE